MLNFSDSDSDSEVEVVDDGASLPVRVLPVADGEAAQPQSSKSGLKRLMKLRQYRIRFVFIRRAVFVFKHRRISRLRLMGKGAKATASIAQLRKFRSRVRA